MLVFHRHQLKNEQKLKVARSLLRVSWSLTFSTISDLVNALRPSTQTGLYTVDELELFCQVYMSLETFRKTSVPSQLLSTGKCGQEYNQLYGRDGDAVYDWN